MNYFVTLVVVCGSICGIHKIKKWLYNYCCDPLSYVIVTGDRRYTTNDEIKYLIAQLGTLGTFITQDVNIIHEQIAQLSWIDQVSVRKKWPDTLKIHIVEYVPVAYWNDDLFINTDGITFKVPNHHMVNKNNDNNATWIPVLYGPESKSRDVLNNYLIFQKILKPNEFQIQSVKMNICCSWQLSLIGGICLKLGRENVIERLSYFIKIYPILIQKKHEQNKRQIDYIDLRYRSGFAIKWINNSIAPIVLYN